MKISWSRKFGVLSESSLLSIFSLLDQQVMLMYRRVWLFFPKIVKPLGQISKFKKCGVSLSNLSTVNLRFLSNSLNAFNTLWLIIMCYLHKNIELFSFYFNIFRLHFYVLHNLYNSVFSSLNFIHGLTMV